MLTGVAFCPQAPALVPEVGRGADVELGPVRAACREAIRRVVVPGSRIVVVGSGPVNAAYGPTSRGSFAGFGVDLVVPLGSDDRGDDPADDPDELPPSLAVGAWLVRDALGPDSGASGYAISADDDLVPDLDHSAPTALIVMGEGSARRTEKAPGYFDPRAEEYDRRLAAALSGGVGHELNAPLVDPHPTAGYEGLEGVPVRDVEQELLVAGHWVRDAVATEVEAGEWDAELLYEGAPFGVGYLVAAWTAKPPTPEQRAAAERSAEILHRWDTDPQFRRTHRVVLRG